MHVIYLSSSVPPLLYKKYSLCHSPAAQKFNNSIIEGLRLNGCEVSVLGLFVCDLESKQVVEEINGVRYYINRHGTIFQRFMSLFNFWKSVGRTDTIVISDYLGYLNNIVFKLLNIWNKIPSCAIVTDLPEYAHFKDVSKVKSLTLGIVGHLILRCYKCHVFLTEGMAEKVHSRHYAVVEGVVLMAQGLTRDVEWDQRKKRIVYAGSLHREFGIIELIDTFVKANLEDYNLCIYGDGNYKKEVVEATTLYGNIRYYGVRPMSEVESIERHSMLLINPRNDREEFTKYSFPSKNIEYMSSGTPMLAHKLSGIPDEYLEHMYIFSSTDTDDMAVDIKNVINKSPDELESMAKRARKFVLSEKNSKVQSKKIIDLINSL